MNEYELMQVINRSGGDMYSGDIDSEPVTQGNAMAVIKFILEHDLDVEGYKLVKRALKTRNKPETKDERLLNAILAVVNRTIHIKQDNPHRRNDAFYADRMREICAIATEHREKYNIYG